MSSAEEFYEIKPHVSKPILLLDPIYENITRLAGCGCEFCVSNLTQLKLYLTLAKEQIKIKFNIHLAFNTGMNRFGFNSNQEIMQCFDLIKKTQNISIIGIFSHFFAGNIRKFAKMQVDKFNGLKSFLADKIDTSHLIFHISNTAGFVNECGFDMCRIGLGMFLNNNKSIFSLEAKIIEIQHLKKGETIGYGGSLFVAKKTDVAVVAIGYADGVFRRIAGRGLVLVRGKFCKVLAVCMDSIIVDVTDVKVTKKDKVTLIGKNGAEEISACDFALWCDTIEYEIMTRISKRVKRIYIGGKYANHNRKI